MSPQSELSSDEFSSLESTNNMSLLMEDETLQDMSDESNFEDHREAPFDEESQHSAPNSVEIDLDDYEEASFDDAFNDLHHPQTVE